MIRVSILRKHYAWHIAFAVAVLVFGTSIAAFAASTPIPLTWQKLRENALLKKQITLEAKHLPLSTLLAQVSEQSGVNIALSPNSSLSQKLVTARISQMNLFDFMGAIGRTYNAAWSKAGGAFILTPKDDDAIAEGISQMGTPAFFQYKDQLLPADAQKMPEDKDIKAHNALYQKVLLAVDRKTLASDRGLPLHALPPTLVDALKSQFQKANAASLLLKHSAYKEISEDDIVRIIGKPDPALEYLGDLLNGNIPYPLYDKVITLEVLTPDKKSIFNGSLYWMLLGKWLPPKLVE